jgi:hypothetical protein
MNTMMMIVCQPATIKIETHISEKNRKIFPAQRQRRRRCCDDDDDDDDANKDTPHSNTTSVRDVRE